MAVVRVGPGAVVEVIEARPGRASVVALHGRHSQALCPAGFAHPGHLGSRTARCSRHMAKPAQVAGATECRWSEAGRMKSGEHEVTKPMDRCRQDGRDREHCNPWRWAVN